MRLPTSIVSMAALVIVSAASAREAHAQTKPLHGGPGLNTWVFTFTTQFGTFPVPITFAKGRRCTVATAVRDVPCVYRESGSDFSVATEAKRDELATFAFTLVMRGAKSTDSSASGAAYFITETPDPDGQNPLGLVTVRGPFTASRQ
jgi:hypothetical protein